MKPYLAIVDLPEGADEQYPFRHGETVLILGEIEQMQGHCVLVYNGTVLCGYHTENFRRLDPDQC